MIDGIIMCLAGFLAALLGFRVLGPRPGESPRWDRWHDRFGIAVRVLGVVVVLAGLALVGWRLYQGESGPAAATQVEPPTIRVEGQTISSGPLGFQLTFSDWWRLDPPGPGADFLAVHQDSGAALIGTALPTSPPGATPDAIITMTIDSRTADWGSVANLERGETKIGARPARWAVFSAPEQHEATRLKLFVAQKGPYTITFTCMGNGAAHDACDTVLAQAALP
jgi:hypothetical protein